MDTQESGHDGNGGVAIATGTADEYPDEIIQIGDRIVNLTLIQAVQLKNYLEEVHGIKSASGVPQIRPPEPDKTEKVPEQTEFSVILDGYEPDKKINVIKTFHEITSFALKEAKEFVENSSGKPIKEGIPKADAEKIAEKLKAAGAKVSIK